jgi:hypothetical protein
MGTNGQEARGDFAVLSMRRPLRLAAAAGIAAALTATSVPAVQASVVRSQTRVVGRLTSWVPHMPTAATAGGRALTFTFDTKQTSHYLVWLQLYVGMFAVNDTAAARSENRGVKLRWYDPVTKAWMKPIHIDRTGGWLLGPRVGFTIRRDQVLRIRVKIWFSKRAWLGQHQLEAIVNDYGIETSSGQSVNATLSQPNNPQYTFTVRR